MIFFVPLSSGENVRIDKIRSRRLSRQVIAEIPSVTPTLESCKLGLACIILSRQNNQTKCKLAQTEWTTIIKISPSAKAWDYAKDSLRTATLSSRCSFARSSLRQRVIAIMLLQDLLLGLSTRFRDLTHATLKSLNWLTPFNEASTYLGVLRLTFPRLACTNLFLRQRVCSYGI